MAEPAENENKEQDKQALPPKKKGYERLELRLVADVKEGDCTLHFTDGNKVEQLDGLKGSVIRIKAKRFLKYNFLDKVVNVFNDT